MHELQQSNYRTNCCHVSHLASSNIDLKLITMCSTTVTSTYVRFNNNKYQPTSTATPIKSLTADKSGMYTVTPTIVPEYIRAGPCGVGGEDKLLQKYSSACSGYGSGPTTVTVSTAVSVTDIRDLKVTDINRLSLNLSSYRPPYLTLDYKQCSQMARTFTQSRTKCSVRIKHAS